MAAIFRVYFRYHEPGDSRPKIEAEADHDDSRTATADDVEGAIAKVRKSIAKQPYEVFDNEGNATGKYRKGQNIVVHHVDFVSSVDVA